MRSKAVLEKLVILVTPDMDSPIDGEMAVRLEAKVRVCHSQQSIITPGLYGVDDPSDKRIREIAHDELSVLIAMLETLHVGMNDPEYKLHMAKIKYV